MAYVKNVWRFPSAIEVEEHHTGRYGAPGQSRQKKSKATPEQIEKINQYNREKKARRKLRAYFNKNDYFICLTYCKESRPIGMAEAKRDFEKFMKRVRRQYGKYGCKVKWLRNIEVGTRGGWHIHLVINRIPDADIIIKAAWPHGKVVMQMLYEKGGYADLAAYITKTPRTDKRLKEASYSSSRNIPVPDPERKIYMRFRTWKDIKVPAGYYIDKNSVHEGVNPVTGFRYRVYTLLRMLC